MSSDKLENTKNGHWVKCVECGEIIYSGELSRNLRVCPKCGYCFPLDPADRIAALVDEGSLNKFGTQNHQITQSESQNCDWAIVAGEAILADHDLIIAAVNLGFTNRRISQPVCEMLIKATTQAIDQSLPLLVIYTDDEGAGTRNGGFLPDQTLGINAALSRLAREKILYISTLACPNSHSRFPGFACVADIVIAELKAPENTRNSSLAALEENAQPSSKALFRNGMVDMTIPRKKLRDTLTDILDFFC